MREKKSAWAIKLPCTIVPLFQLVVTTDLRVFCLFLDGQHQHGTGPGLLAADAHRLV